MFVDAKNMMERANDREILGWQKQFLAYIKLRKIFSNLNPTHLWFFDDGEMKVKIEKNKYL